MTKNVKPVRIPNMQGLYKMSIMIQFFRFGKSISRCDAKCYNSKSANCTCCCEGKLHGVGRNRAVSILRKNKPFYRQIAWSVHGADVSFF